MPRRSRLALLALVLTGFSGASAPRAADWAAGELERHARQPDRLRDGVARIGRLDGVYSVLVAHGGQLIAESYFREGTRAKPHNLKSASKSVISALVGIAIEEGRIGLDQPIAELLPAARPLPASKAAITVRHLLTMTSGLEPTSYAGYSRWIESSDWVAAALAVPLVARPGDVFQYSTANTHLLSAVLTAATGQSTRSYAEQRLFGPIDVTVKGWETDPRGIHVGGNNLSLTPRAMARFGELYLRRGRWGGRQVVPKSWVELSTRATRRGLHRVYGTYGYLWWTDLVYEGAFAAVGFGGQYIYVSPPHDAVVVVTSTLESKGEVWTAELFDALRNQILAALGPDPGYYQGRPPVDPALASLASALDRARQQVAALDAPRTDLENFAPRRARTLARVNLRQQPDTDSPRLTVLEHGSAIEILELSQPWLRARAKGLEGWVHADYVRLDEISWRRAAAELRRDLELLARAIEPHLEEARANGGGVAPPAPETSSPTPGGAELARMGERIEDLEARLATSRAERDEALLTADELTARLAAAAAQRDAERDRAAGLTSQLEALAADHESDRRERDRRRTREHQAAERQAAATQVALEEARQRLDEIETELADERRRAAAVETRATKLETDRNDLERHLEQAERGLRVAEEALAEERLAATQRLRQAAAESALLETAAAAASGELEALRAAVQEAEVRRLSAEDALASERRDGTASRRQAGAKIEALEAAVDEAKTGRRQAEVALEDERRRTDERLRLADEQIEALQAAVGDEQTERRQAEAAIEDERRRTDERLRLADEQIEALQAAVDDEQTERRQAEAAIEDERRRTDERLRLADERIEALQAAVDEATAEAEEEKGSAVAERPARTEQQLAALELALEDAQGGRRQAEAALEQLRRETAERLRQANEEIETLRAAAHTAETQRSALAARQTDAVDEQNEKIRALEASLAAAEARSRALAVELDDLRAAWLEQQIELEDARRAARPARPPPAPLPSPRAPQRPDLSAYLAAWAQAWASGSVADYLAFYAADYPFADAGERVRWAARSTPSPRPTRVRLRDLQTSDPESPTVRVRFLLEYRVGPRTVSTTKLLDLVRTADSWQIHGETPRP